MTFSERLRAARKKTGSTAKEFAKELGLNYTTYINYENAGTEPKQETLIKIADKLNISVDTLLGHHTSTSNELQNAVDLIKDYCQSQVDCVDCIFKLSKKNCSLFCPEDWR